MRPLLAICKINRSINWPVADGWQQNQTLTTRYTYLRLQTTHGYIVNSYVYFTQVDEYMDTFQYEMAQKFCQRALEMEPDNVRVLEVSGTLLLEVGELEKAKQVTVYLEWTEFSYFEIFITFWRLDMYSLSSLYKDLNSLQVDIVHFLYLVKPSIFQTLSFKLVFNSIGLF